MDKFINFAALGALATLVSCASNDEPELPSLDTETPSYEEVFNKRDQLDRERQELPERVDDTYDF